MRDRRILEGRTNFLPAAAEDQVHDWGEEVDAMATYEFECRTCGKQFDVTMAMSEHDKLKEQPPACPECGKSETRQLASSFSCKAPSKY